MKELEASSFIASENNGEGWQSAISTACKKSPEKNFKYIMAMPQTQNVSQGVTSLVLAESKREPWGLDRDTWNTMACANNLG